MQKIAHYVLLTVTWCFFSVNFTVLHAQEASCRTEVPVAGIVRAVSMADSLQTSTLASLPDNIALDMRMGNAQISYNLPIAPCPAGTVRGLYIGANVTSYTLVAQLGASDQALQPLRAVQPPANPATEPWAQRSGDAGLIYSGRAPTVYALPEGAKAVRMQLQTPSNFPFGLGVARLGPLEATLLTHGNDERVGLAEQSSLAMVMGVVGAMALLAWCVRRKDLALLFFGFATLVFALRTGLDYTQLIYLPPLFFENFIRWTLVLLAITLTSANLIAVNAWSVSIQRGMLLIGAGFSALFLALLIPGIGRLQLNTMGFRWIAFGLSVLLTVYAMWHTFAARQRVGLVRAGAVLIAYALILAVGQVIAMRNVGQSGFSHGGYFIYAYSVLVLVVGALVGERALRALQRAEGLNAELAQRVAEKNNELAQFYAQQRDAELQAEREGARQHERERLTREMHDGIGAQLMTALRGVERGAYGTAQVAQSLQDGLDELRLLMDSADVGRSLQGALATWRNRWDARLAAVGLGLVWEIDGAIEGVVLPEDTVLQLMRIVQEAVTNAVKHANASHITVNAGLLGSILHLEVCDNGAGLPVQTFASTPDLTSNTTTQRGLRHIAHRASAIGGQCNVRSLAAPAHGVCVRVSLPVLVQNLS
jgi:signal transduction histidine kinase